MDLRCSLARLVGFKRRKDDRSDNDDADKRQCGRHVVVINGRSDPEASHHRSDDRESESNDAREVDRGDGVHVVTFLLAQRPYSPHMVDKSQEETTNKATRNNACRFSIELDTFVKCENPRFAVV